MTDTLAIQQDLQDTERDAVRAGAQQAFKNHLKYLSSGRIVEWTDLFTEDGILEFPYGPQGFRPGWRARKRCTTT